MCVLVTQSCPALCDPMDCSRPVSSVYGILQAGLLEWVPISFSKESSQPGDWTQVSHIAGRFFTIWATTEAPYLDWPLSNFSLTIHSLSWWGTCVSNHIKLDTVFFFLFFFKFYFIFKLYITVLVLPNIKMNPPQVKIWNASQICVSSLRRGHANLLCIVPILVYVLPKWAPNWTL